MCLRTSPISCFLYFSLFCFLWGGNSGELERKQPKNLEALSSRSTWAVKFMFLRLPGCVFLVGHVRSDESRVLVGRGLVNGEYWPNGRLPPCCVCGLERKPATVSSQACIVGRQDWSGRGNSLELATWSSHKDTFLKPWKQWPWHWGLRWHWYNYPHLLEGLSGGTVTKVFLSLKCKACK